MYTTIGPTVPFIATDWFSTFILVAANGSSYNVWSIAKCTLLLNAYCISRAARTTLGPVISHRHAVALPVTPQKVGPIAQPTAAPTRLLINSRHTSKPTRLASGIASYRFTAATICTPLSSKIICTMGQRFVSNIAWTSINQFIEQPLDVMAMNSTHTLRICAICVGENPPWLKLAKTLLWMKSPSILIMRNFFRSSIDLWMCHRTKLNSSGSSTSSECNNFAPNGPSISVYVPPLSRKLKQLRLTHISPAFAKSTNSPISNIASPPT